MIKLIAVTRLIVQADIDTFLLFFISNPQPDDKVDSFQYEQAHNECENHEEALC